MASHPKKHPKYLKHEKTNLNSRNPVFSFLTIAQKNADECIKLETDKIFDKLVALRRRFHENPELAGKEKRTQEVIKKYLLDLGLQIETDIYGYGIVGILNGAKKGKNIVWRADMDALPL